MPELDQYDYDLPRHLIAQEPLPCRVDARLMVVDRRRRSLLHKHIRDLGELVRPGDCLVLNDTRVIPARLLGYRARTGGRWRGLFLESDSQGLWRVLCKSRGRLADGESITLLDRDGRSDIQLVLGSKLPDGTWPARPQAEEGAMVVLERVGRVPLPPYIRNGEMVDADQQHYQTVYARVPGAVAAPTAGLHFTEPLLQQLQSQGVELCWLTLHVGLGTFRPISADWLDDHRMHPEWGTIGPQCVAAVSQCRRRGGRVIAVGTTCARLLETAAAGGTVEPFTGSTDLFIRPPFEFRAVDALLTNFHLPRTTLLVLVRTFGGDVLMHQAYQEAIRQEYRFYSYGDAMLIQ